MHVGERAAAVPSESRRRVVCGAASGLFAFVVSTDETLCSCSGSDLLSAMAVARSEEGIDEGSDEGRMVERKEGDG